MIDKIKITKKYRSIPENFELSLKKTTVITGENNSGKTNFIKAVSDMVNVKFFDESGKELVPEIVYIAAENIKPSDSECKPSAKTTGLIKNLSSLFSNMKFKFEIEKKNEIISHIEDLIDKTNQNLESFTGNKKNTHKLEIDLNKDELDSGIIIQSLINKVTGFEDGKKRKLEELGQGTQRIIVVSILKAYVDILIEKEIHTEKPILILFEEPEIYLHPKLKRTLNATLEKISERDNHQVIITTHDPYFAFQNFRGKEKTIFSFLKEKGKEFTEISSEKIINGIEDELLFIFLYGLLEEKEEDLTKEIDGFKKRKYFWKNKEGVEQEEDIDDLVCIRHQIHHLGDNPHTIGLVSEEPKDCDGINYYTEEELAGAIRLMSKILGESDI